MPYQSNPSYINYISVQPDWAIITHGNPPQPDVPPYSAPCTAVDSNTAPVRKVYYGPNSRVDGPNGAILPIGTNADVKIFGSESAHASIAHINTTQYNMLLVVTDADNDGGNPPHTCGGQLCAFTMQPLHQFQITSGGLIQPGDSGAIVWRQDTKALLGALIAVSAGGSIGYAMDATSLKTAAGFSHYWGTGSSYRKPAATETDSCKP